MAVLRVTFFEARLWIKKAKMGIVGKHFGCAESGFSKWLKFRNVTTRSILGGMLGLRYRAIQIAASMYSPCNGARHAGLSALVAVGAPWYCDVLRTGPN